MAQSLPRSFQQPRRIGQRDAVVETQVDVLFQRHHVAVGFRHFLRTPAVADRLVASAGDFVRLRVEFLNEGT